MSDQITVITNPLEVARLNDMVKTWNCRWCKASLRKQPFQCYPHEDGWTVKGFATKVWIYIDCPKCLFSWSIWKLGVPRE